jgi:hypothetical protein
MLLLWFGYVTYLSQREKGVFYFFQWFLYLPFRRLEKGGGGWVSTLCLTHSSWENGSFTCLHRPLMICAMFSRQVKDPISCNHRVKYTELDHQILIGLKTHRCAVCTARARTLSDLSLIFEAIVQPKYSRRHLFVTLLPCNEISTFNPAALGRGCVFCHLS